MLSGRRLVIKPAANSTWGPEAMAQWNANKNERANNLNLPKVWNTGAPPPPNAGPMHMVPSGGPGNAANRGGTGFEVTNDCEIIVMSRALTTYAEFIETRLKSMGMTVDLLFPNSEVPLGKVLSNISSRGCLYAILVTPLNEEHRSITVHILYGQPAEHRNMPIQDAINFIDTNFTNYRSSMVAAAATANVSLSSHRHSDAIQALLRALAENRTLTVLQYDTIIQYLQERREAQIKEELGDAAAKMMPDKTEEEKLQEKILSILDKPTISQNMMSIEVDTSEVVLGNGLEILMDVKVQRALDSLLRSCVAYK